MEDTNDTKFNICIHHHELPFASNNDMSDTSVGQNKEENFSFPFFTNVREVQSFRRINMRLLHKRTSLAVFTVKISDRNTPSY